MATLSQGARIPRISAVPGASSCARSSTSAVPAVALWVLVWAGYNTNLHRILDEPSFPTGALDFFHGVRSLFPHFAAFLACIVILKRGSVSRAALSGPIGLVALYTLLGLLSSVLLSDDVGESLYWAVDYASVLLVLLAILWDANPLSSLSRLLNVNWIMVTIATVGLVSALSFFADLALVPTEGSPLGVKAYGGEFGYSGEMLGMAATRNTGFGRFAALAALICLAKLWQKKLRSKLLWPLLLVNLFAMVLAQARTATLAFLAGALVMVWVHRGSRIMLWAGGISVGVLLAFTGFYSALWAFGTRGGSFDPTLSGRTAVWEQGWDLFKHSPLLGFGFYGDRLQLNGMDVHNPLLQSLIYAGVLGAIPLAAAFVVAWIQALQLYKGKAARNRRPLPLEVPCLLAFVTVASITEPTFSLYSVPWLMIAPCFAYLQLMHQQRAVESRLTHQAAVTAALRQPALGFRRTSSTGGWHLR